MLTVTKAALDAIREHLRQHSIDSAVRITMMRGDCKGESLRFTIGNRQINDLVFAFDGISFLVDRELVTQCGTIHVDFEEKYDHCSCSGRNGGFCISSERFSFSCGGAVCGHSCLSVCIKCSPEACHLSRSREQPVSAA